MYCKGEGDGKCLSGGDCYLSFSSCMPNHQMDQQMSLRAIASFKVFELGKTAYDSISLWERNSPDWKASRGRDFATRYRLIIALWSSL